MPRGTTRLRPKKRSMSEFARIYGSKARVAWIKSLPCIARPGCVGPIQNAHTETGGMGRKAGYETIVPACAGHHGELHAHGVQAFEAKYQVSLTRYAADIAALWRRVAGKVGA